MYLLIFSSRLAATVVFLLSVMSLPEVSSLINLDRVVDSIGSRHWLKFCAILNFGWKPDVSYLGVSYPIILDVSL